MYNVSNTSKYIIQYVYIYIHIYIYILYIYNSSFLDPAEEASELWREYKRGEKGEGAASEPKGK